MHSFFHQQPLPWSTQIKHATQRVATPTYAAPNHLDSEIATLQNKCCVLEGRSIASVVGGAESFEWLAMPVQYWLIVRDFAWLGPSPQSVRVAKDLDGRIKPDSTSMSLPNVSDKNILNC